MQKYFYPIFKLPDYYVRDYQKQELPLWVKWWLLGKAGRKLSEILTGSEFTLLHTLNKKFKIFELKGQTSQETLTGKNLLNLPNGTYTRAGVTTIRENGKLKVNGTYQAGDTLYLVPNTEISIPAGTYKVSIDEKLSKGLIIAFRGTNWTNATIIPNATSDTVTFDEEKDTIAIYFYGLSDGDTFNTIIKPMVRLTSVTDGTWEPYCRTEYQHLILYIKYLLKM